MYFFSSNSAGIIVIMNVFLHLVYCRLPVEKALAQTSKDKGTKEAFSIYISDTRLIFQPGLILGRKFWQDAGQRTELPIRGPVFAAISSAGDLGYTATN